MNDVIVTVRLPRKLKEDVDFVVKDGCFKNMSDLIVASVRKEVEIYKPSRATLLTRQIRKEIWEEYLAKAKGNPKKAVELMGKDEKKFEEAEPDFFKF